MSQALGVDRDVAAAVVRGNGDLCAELVRPSGDGVVVGPARNGQALAAGPRALQRSCEPAFLVGVTGLMHLERDSAEVIQERVRCILRFLRGGKNWGRPRTRDGHELSMKLLLDLVPSAAGRDVEWRELRLVYRRFLDSWPGLGDTPIVVLSSLAPGADTLVAEVALEKEFRDANISVRAPLPFPADVYREASTFVRSRPGAPDPQDAIRQKKYDDLLKRIGDENTFVVRLASDRRRPLADATHRDARRLKRFLADRENRDRRQRRYYAAGEYIARYCHLLLAIWDGRPGDGGSGTGDVVDARLLGPRPGVLPDTSGVALPHGGPVWHLVAARARDPGAAPDGSRASNDATHGNNENQGRDAPGHSVANLNGAAMRFLHPVTPANDGHIPGSYDSQPLDGALQEERLALFSRIAELLRRYNEECRRKPVGRTECGREFRKRLTFVPPANPAHTAGAKRGAAVEAPEAHEQPLVLQLRSNARAFRAALRRVSDARRQAADASGHHQGSHKLTLIVAFLLTLFAAASLHFFAHWHAADSPPRDAPGEAVASPQVVARGHAAVHGATGSVARTGAGLLAFLLVSFGLLFFARQRSRQAEERAHDQRALAEGLRVQFYWNLAGLGRSVSANYMQRHRSELDWIRAAIRSMTFPYEQWSDWFAELSPRLKLLALRCAARGWIEDQRQYHSREWKKQARTMHCWHAVGRSAALAGILTFLICWLSETAPRAERGLSANRLLLLGIGALALVLWTLAVRRMRRRHRIQSGSHATLKAKRDVRWQRMVESCLVTGHGPAATPTSSGQHLWLLLKGFACCVVPSIGLAAVIYAVCLFAGGHSGLTPEAVDVGIIVGGWLLLGGAMAVAWAEKNFYSELAYQYHTMESLFAHAALRIARDLEQLESLTTDPADREEFDKTVRRIQKFLFSLGKEALDENAEWLLLHRARPLEPVMAG